MKDIKAIKEIMELDEKLLFYGQVELVKEGCRLTGSYLVGRLNANGGS